MITYRITKGSALTYNELDQNFSYLDNRITTIASTNAASGGFITYADLNASGDLVYDANTGTFSITLPHTTDDLPEGNTNLYYTTARANSAIDARVTKSFIDALAVNADTWDGFQFADYLNQPVRTTDNVIFSSVSVTGNVDITGDITNVESIQFNTNHAHNQPPTGHLGWNQTDGTLNVGMNGNTVVLQVGLEQLSRVYNPYANTIPNGSVLRIIGSFGGCIEVNYADSLSQANSSGVIGMATEDIPAMSFGYAAINGCVRELDTSMWLPGDELYLANTPGGLTNVKPISPEHPVRVGWVGISNTANGSVYVSVFEPSNAVDVSYDNTSSMLLATNAQSAIDELQYTKASVDQLASNITLYYTNANSDIVGYYHAASTVTDPLYPNTAIDFTTPPISSNNFLIATFAANTNLFIGNPGVFAISTLGKIRKVSGSKDAAFYFEVYHRDGTTNNEVLVSTSNLTDFVTSTVYTEFSAAAQFNDGIFADVDRLVVRWYGVKSDLSAGGSPVYQIEIGGNSPARTLLPVPVSVIPSSLASDILTDTTNFTKILSGADSSVQLALDTLDNHIHPISDITNLQTTLNSKLNLTGGTITGNLTVNGTLTAGNSFVGTSRVFHDTYHPLADKLTNARNIALTGDVAGNVNFDGSANVSITTTIQPNSVALGTDTTGNYIATATAGNNMVIAGSGTETAAITVSTVQNPIFTTSVTAPIFYDSSNASFYGDFAGTSNLNGLTVASTITGSISGNAGTATKLATARTIALTGAITGSATFDGSANASISTAFSSAPTFTGSVSAPIFYDSDNPVYYLDPNSASVLSGLTVSSPIVASITGNANTATALQHTRTFSLSGDVVGSATFNGTANTNIVATIQPNSVALGTDTTGNYASAVTSGNNISVAGIAGEGTSFKVSTIQNPTFTTSVSSPIFYDSANTSFYVDPAGTSNLNGLTVNGTITGSVSGNSGTATKLATARTIALSGDVAGSVLFDGSANATITTTIQPNSVSLGTDTTGNYVLSVAAGNNMVVTGSGTETAAVTVATSQSPTFTASVASPIYYDSDNPAYYLDPNSASVLNGLTVSSPIVASITGNANTATALQHTRTIALTGDVSGSSTFDGTANATITATIQPNSVALGTDTTGNYVSNITAGTNIFVSGGGTENANVTVSVAGNPSFFAVDATKVEIASTGTSGLLGLTRSDAGVDEKGWYFSSTTSGVFNINSRSDAGAFGESAFRIYRSGTAITSHEFLVGTNSILTVDANGINVAKVTDSANSSFYVQPSSNTVVNNLTVNGTLVAGSFTANSALTLATPRTIALAGDVAGSTTFDGSANVTINATVQPNSVALGTDTTGNYVSGLSGGTHVNITGTAGEGWTPTVNVDATNLNTASTIVARDASGNFVAGTITASLSGNASTATKLATARTIALTGDISGSVSFDGSANVSISTAIQPNSVALGTDTTGNYAGSVSAGNNIVVAGTAGEGTAFTVSTSQSPTFTTSVSAPIFYDSNNTAFYIDPNSTSVVNQLNATRIGVENATSVPLITMGRSNASLNAKTWYTGVSTTGILTINTSDDTGAFGQTASRIYRSGTTVTEHALLVNTTEKFIVNANGAFIDGTNEVYNDAYHPLADKLTTARLISLSGDVSGSASFDGSSNITISTTVQPNSVALGTDTTGSYTESLSSNNLTVGITVVGDGASYTIDIPDNTVHETVPFASRAVAEAATISANVTSIQVYHDGKILTYLPDAVFDANAALITTGGTVSFHPGDVNVMPQHWGVTSDQANGQTTMFQSAVDYCKINEKILYVPEGDYLLEDEINWYYSVARLNAYGMIGSGPQTTRFWYNFTNTTKTVFQFSSGLTTQTLNQANKTIGGFSIQSVFGNDWTIPSPCLIDISGLGNSEMKDIYLAPSNNTQIRGSRWANMVMTNVFATGGGYNFQPYDTSGITVSGTAGANVVTISSGTIPADMTGMTIRILTSPQQIHTIASANSTAFTVTGTLDGTFSGVSFDFGAPLVSTTAGSNTIQTSATGTFSSNNVGLWVYIEGAKTGSYPLRAQITAVANSTHAQIDRNADLTVSGGEIVVAAMDISDYLTKGSALTDITNDFRTYNCSIVRFSGLGVAISDAVKFKNYGLKVHGVSDQGSIKASQGYMWIWNSAGHFDMIFDQSSASKWMNRIFDIKSNGITFGNIDTTCSTFQYLFEMGSQSSNGFVSCHDIIGNVPGVAYVVDEKNSSPKLQVNGVVYGFYNPDTFVSSILPNTPRFGPTGSVYNGYIESSYTPYVADSANNTVSIGKTVDYIVNGNQVTVFFNFINNINVTGLTSTDTARLSLPPGYALKAHAFAAMEAKSFANSSPDFMRGPIGNDFVYLRDTTAHYDLKISDIGTGSTIADIVGCTFTYYYG